MGKYEDQLKAMGTAGAEWKIEEFAALEAQMAQLKLDMAAIAKNPGWTGNSADAASALFLKMKDTFEGNEKKLATAKTAINTANDVRVAAAAKQSSLPDAGVPDWVHVAALVGGTVLIPGIGSFAAEVVVQKVNEFMGKQREAVALQALTDMSNDLGAPQGQLSSNTISGEVWPDGPPAPDWPGDPIVWDGDDTGSGSWSSNGTVPWSGSGTVIGEPPVYKPKPPVGPEEPEVIIHYPPNPPIQLPPVNPPGWPGSVNIAPPTVSIDGDSGGGSNPGGFLGGGGGLGAGLAGAGIAGGVGAKIASKGGLGGAGGLFGPNGVLGGGGAAAGANGAGSKGGLAGAAGGAGSKGGATGMMGGGGGGAGGSQKEKRTSLGLMAPKLEDDEENGPRSAAADAGGRE